MLWISLHHFTLLTLKLASSTVKGHPTDLEKSCPRHPMLAEEPLTPMSTNEPNQVAESPRIADVLRHLSSTGELHWTDDGSGYGGLVIEHTFAEWAAAEEAILGYKADTVARQMMMNADSGAEVSGEEACVDGSAESMEYAPGENDVDE